MLTVKIKRRRVNYELAFPYNKELVDKIKRSDEPKWDGKKKTWVLDAMNLYLIMSTYKGRKDIFFKFTDQKERSFFIKKLEDMKKELKEQEKRVKEKLEKEQEVIRFKKHLPEIAKEFDFSPYIAPGINLFHHQKQAALFLKEVKKGFLAMEMGTGKTLASLVGSEIIGFKKVMVICPNSLKHNWASEIEKFIREKYYIINYNKNKYSVDEAKYFIVNYEYFSRNFDKKKKLDSIGVPKVDCLIADESHRLKNTTSNTYKNISKVFGSGKVPYCILLSGTIMPNRVEELFGQLRFIEPDIFNNKAKFMTEWGGLENSAWGWDYPYKIKKDPFLFKEYLDKMNQQLHYKLQPYTFRVMKSDVLDLPPKTFTNIILEMTDKEEKVYMDIEEGVANEVFSKKEMAFSDIMTIMLRLRQYTGMLKVNELVETVKRQVDEGQKVVVFDCFKEPLYKIKDRLGEVAVVYTGDITDVSERQRMVEEFQDPDSKVKVFLTTMAAGSVGLTLTAASTLHLLTLDYVPANNEQAVARIDRISQTNNIQIFTWIIENSIDERVYDMTINKLKNINKVVDNEEYESVAVEKNITDIINAYKDKYKITE